MPIENHDFFKVEHSRIQPAQGRVLVSDPALSDFYFSRAVVLLTEHNEKGTIGFVLNKPIQASLDELLKDFPEFKAHVSVGGPVNPNSVHFIHTLGMQIPGAVHIFANLFWGGEFEELKGLIRQGLVTSHQVKFFFGYSGWAPKQLITEMKLDSWVVSILDSDMIMEQGRDMWKQAVENLGEEFRVWLNYPENPNMN
ncbi:MAG TPA: YqgE/AlgH family protein [Williamwhitmania sp.]|nr:YqgE/AlgH family protein [Williamwhitmania sp.]